jgi:predicted ArsR family transcriptional regulator
MNGSNSSMAIKYFLKSEFLKDKSRWFSVREVSKHLGLSIDRTRRHLSWLVLKGKLKTRVDGWHNVYCFYKD